MCLSVGVCDLYRPRKKVKRVWFDGTCVFCPAFGMTLEFLLQVSATIAVIYIIMHILYVALIQRLKDFKFQTWSQVDSKGYVRLYFVAAMQAMYKDSGVFYPLNSWEKLIPLNFDESDKTVDNDKNKDFSKDEHKAKPNQSVEDILKEYPGTKAIFIPPAEESVTATDCILDLPRLLLYRQCIAQHHQPTQHASHSGLPPCFLMSHFNKVLIGIGSADTSRMRALGCVHIRQQMTIHKDLSHLLHESFRWVTGQSD